MIRCGSGKIYLVSTKAPNTEQAREPPLIAHSVGACTVGGARHKQRMNAAMAAMRPPAAPPAAAVGTDNLADACPRGAGKNR